MKKTSAWYGPHLVVREVVLPPGDEWVPKIAAWCLLQVVSGSGYWLQPQLQHALEPGAMILLSPELQGGFRASQIGELRLNLLPVEPERLIGLFTLDEQRVFQGFAARASAGPRVFGPATPLALRFQSLCGAQGRSGVSFRLELLQVFFDAFGDDLAQAAVQPKSVPDAKERLRELLKQTPVSQLVTMNFSDLRAMTRCTPRHLSRIFQEVVGVSFRDKHTELRLARACELLATTEAKIVDVAMESGYQSLSLFNLMFSRRFGMSPGRWRQTMRKQHSPSGAVRGERPSSPAQPR